MQPEAGVAARVGELEAMNQPAPPQLRATNTPSVANPTVTATRPITRPNSAGVWADAWRSV
jgi:hypothetical protein